MLRVRVEAALSAVVLPELADAEQALGELEQVAQELLMRERLLVNPSDATARAVLGSIELSERLAAEKLVAEADKEADRLHRAREEQQRVALLSPMPQETPANGADVSATESAE